MLELCLALAMRSQEALLAHVAVVQLLNGASLERSLDEDPSNVLEEGGKELTRLARAV